MSFLSLCYLISLDSVQAVEGKRKVFSKDTIKQEPDVAVLGFFLEDSSSPCVGYMGMLYSCRYLTYSHVLQPVPSIFNQVFMEVVSFSNLMECWCHNCLLNCMISRRVNL